MTKKHLTAAAVAGTILLGGAATLVAMRQESAAEVVEGRDYEALDERLEPFRSDFNAASDHVRAVLLVGPT